MDAKKLYERVFAIFGTTMVFFYIGLGIFIISSSIIDIDKALRVIFGAPLIMYGLYRAVTSYTKIKESFFSNDEE